jgi:hypothetical protein
MNDVKKRKIKKKQSIIVSTDISKIGEGKGCNNMDAGKA